MWFLPSLSRSTSMNSLNSHQRKSATNTAHYPGNLSQIITDVWNMCHQSSTFNSFAYSESPAAQCDRRPVRHHQHHGIRLFHVRQAPWRRQDKTKQSQSLSVTGLNHRRRTEGLSFGWHALSGCANGWSDFTHRLCGTAGPVSCYLRVNETLNNVIM